MLRGFFFTLRGTAPCVDGDCRCGRPDCRAAPAGGRPTFGEKGRRQARSAASRRSRTSLAKHDAQAPKRSRRPPRESTTHAPALSAVRCFSQRGVSVSEALCARVRLRGARPLFLPGLVLISEPDSAQRFRTLNTRTSHEMNRTPCFSVPSASLDETQSKSICAACSARLLRRAFFSAFPGHRSRDNDGPNFRTVVFARIFIPVPRQSGATTQRFSNGPEKPQTATFLYSVCANAKFARRAGHVAQLRQRASRMLSGMRRGRGVNDSARPHQFSPPASGKAARSLRRSPRDRARHAEEETRPSPPPPFLRAFFARRLEASSPHSSRCAS